MPADVLEGLDFVPVGFEGDVRLEEEDVVDLVFAPFAARRFGRVDDPGQVGHLLDGTFSGTNLKFWQVIVNTE